MTGERMAALHVPSGNLGRTNIKTAPAGNRRLILTAIKERVMTDSHSTQVAHLDTIIGGGINGT